MARHITQEVDPLWRRRCPKLISQKNGTWKTFSSNFRPINITENKFSVIALQSLLALKEVTLFQNTQMPQSVDFTRWCALLTLLAKKSVRRGVGTSPYPLNSGVTKNNNNNNNNGQ